ncbi:hypothetical protein [Succinivibrio dextrinosolvens]|uniref:hypothetical protein n=1 Tax=Succinivibrio dextrinosolvens TaxID=83771 RepID=UPI0012DDB2DA|nr:hypothetical protein [Succinivibrio dextrinosolvens]
MELKISDRFDKIATFIMNIEADENLWGYSKTKEAVRDFVKYVNRMAKERRCSSL